MVIAERILNFAMTCSLATQIMTVVVRNVAQNSVTVDLVLSTVVIHRPLLLHLSRDVMLTMTAMRLSENVAQFGGIVEQDPSIAGIPLISQQQKLLHQPPRRIFVRSIEIAHQTLHAVRCLTIVGMDQSFVPSQRVGQLERLRTRIQHMVQKQLPRGRRPLRYQQLQIFQE